MITMLRSLGIPARLAVGFAPGVWDQDRGVWEVQARHYHAWPEVYFPSYGWIEFEPTPADVQPSLEELGFQPRGLVGGVFRVPAENCPDIFEDPTQFDLEGCEDLFLTDDQLVGGLSGLGLEDEVNQQGGSGWAGSLGSPWTLVGIGLALGLAIPVGTVSYVGWGVARLGYPTVVYAGVWTLGRLAGVRSRPQDTPWEYCDRLGNALPEHRDSIADITGGFVASRYSPKRDLTDGQTQRVRAAWRRVRGPLVWRLLRRFTPG